VTTWCARRKQQEQKQQQQQQQRRRRRLRVVVNTCMASISQSINQSQSSPTKALVVLRAGVFYRRHATGVLLTADQTTILARLSAIYRLLSLARGQPANSCSSAYLTETVQSVGASRSRCGLRSSSTSSMDSLPRLRTKFGERAFSHAGPSIRNALPDHIRTVADPVKFWKLLKSHNFRQGFNVC